MARKSLDEIFGKNQEQRKPLSDIFGNQQFQSQITQETQPIEEDKNFLERFGETGGNIMQGAADIFINPIGRALTRPFVEATKGIQKLIPGGKTGEETVATPFGDITPRQIGGTPKEARQESIGETVDLALTALPVEKALTPVFKFFGGAFKRAGGTLTGKGADVIEQIVKNPEAAKKGLRGENVKVIRDMAESARDAVIDLSQSSQKAFSDAVKKLPVDATSNLGKVKTKLFDDLSEFGVKINRASVDAGRKFDFSSSPLRKSEEKVLKEVFETIDNWDDFSGEGLNNLAVKIGNFTKPGDQSNALNGIIGKTKQSIREVLGDAIPEAKEMVTRFAKEQDFLDALRSELSIKNNLKSEKSILDVSKKIQNLFSANKDLTQDLLRRLDVGDDIIATEAGRQLAQAPSRASSSLGDTARGLIQTAISPRVVGELSVLTGVSQRKIQPLMDIMQTLAPAERIGLFNAISSLFGGSQDNQQ